MSYLVKLQYFKPGGKFYISAEFISNQIALHNIFYDIEQMAKKRILPGLRENHPRYIVSVDVPDHPHNMPKLIITK